MTEPFQWERDKSNPYDEDDPYSLSTPDGLGVLSSTRRVVEQGEYVWINREQVELLAAQFLASDTRMSANALQGDYQSPRQASDNAVDTMLPALTWYDRYHFHDGTERTVNWLLVLDALNFCFWAEKNQPRWRIEYQGEPLNGYWAEAASLTRAVEEGLPLWDAEYLSTMSGETLAHIFRGEEMIP